MKKVFIFSQGALRISMKFSGKMWLITILKVTKKQGFTRRKIFGKNTSQTQTIRRLWQTNCLTVSDHFVGLELKGLK